MAPVVSAKFTSDQSVTLFMVRARWRWRWRWGGACGLVGGGGGAVALATARSPPLLLRATPPHLLLLVVPQGTNNENAGTKTELKFFDSTGALQLQVTGTGLFVEKRVLADGQGQTLALMSKNPISMAKWAIKDVEGNQLAKTSTVAGARGGGGGGGLERAAAAPRPPCQRSRCPLVCSLVHAWQSTGWRCACPRAAARWLTWWHQTRPT